MFLHAGGSWPRVRLAQYIISCAFFPDKSQNIHKYFVSLLIIRFFAAQNCSLFSPVFRSLYPKSTKFYQRSVFGIKSLICAGKRARIFTELSQIPRILNKICCFYPKKTAPPVDFGPNLCIMIYRRIRICISFRRPFAVSFWLRTAYRWCLDDDLNERRGDRKSTRLNSSHRL